MLKADGFGLFEYSEGVPPAIVSHSMADDTPAPRKRLQKSAILEALVSRLERDHLFFTLRYFLG